MANWRYHMICTDAAKADSQAFMNSIGAGADGFTVPLSADGSSPPTYWGQSIQLTESQRQAIDAATTGNNYPAGSFWWRCVAARLVSQQTLQDANDANTPGGDIGLPFTFADACAIVGVTPVE